MSGRGTVARRAEPAERLTGDVLQNRFGEFRGGNAFAHTIAANGHPPADVVRMALEKGTGITAQQGTTSTLNLTACTPLGARGPFAPAGVQEITMDFTNDTGPKIPTALAGHNLNTGWAGDLSIPMAPRPGFA